MIYTPGCCAGNCLYFATLKKLPFWPCCLLEVSVFSELQARRYARRLGVVKFWICILHDNNNNNQFCCSPVFPHDQSTLGWLLKVYKQL